MIKLGNFIAVLDACVLYDSLLRDLLLILAEKELYQPIWSSFICEELQRNLNKKIQPEKTQKLLNIMNSAFPESCIDMYSKLPIILENEINEKDRHVLSCAISGGAQVIITNNLKDFPNEVLTKYKITAQSPDEFVTNLFYLSFDKVFETFIKLEKSLKKPPLTREELLDRLNQRTPQLVTLLSPHLADNIIRLRT